METVQPEAIRQITKVRGNRLDVITGLWTQSARIAMPSHVCRNDPEPGLDQLVRNAGQHPIKMTLGDAVSGDDRRTGTSILIV